MILKYNINIKNNTISSRLQSLINQIYKLLPVRQENSDWQKPLQTILEQLSGMQRLINYSNSQSFFSLLNKLEGLFTLINEDDFLCYRRTIFECLSLISSIRKEIEECPQNY